MIPLTGLTAFENPGGLTPAQITAAFDHVDGISTIDYSFRLLDTALNPVPVPGAPAGDSAELPPRYVKGGAIEMNTQRDVHRQMTLDLVELPGLTYNPLFHRLQPHCDFYQNGERVLHIPRGVFLGILPERDLGDQFPVWHLTAYDETYALQQLHFLNNYTVAAGSNLISTVIALLTLPLFPPSMGGSAVTPAGCDMAGPAIDFRRISIPPSASVTPVDIPFTPDDTILKAVNQLLAAGETPYWPLWEDERGNYVSKPVPYFTTAQPDAGWPYDSARVYDPATGQGNIVKPPAKQSFSDQSQLANYVKVLCQSGQSQAFSAWAANTDARSAISIPNLGRVAVKIVKDDKIISQAAAWVRAGVELQLAAALNDTVEVDAVVVPIHQVHDGIPLTLRGQGTATYTGEGETLDVVYGDGPVEVSSGAGRFLEVSWSEDMATRLAHHVMGTTVAI